MIDLTFSLMTWVVTQETFLLTTIGGILIIFVISLICFIKRVR